MLFGTFTGGIAALELLWTFAAFLLVVWMGGLLFAFPRSWVTRWLYARSDPINRWTSYTLPSAAFSPVQRQSEKTLRHQVDASVPGRKPADGGPVEHLPFAVREKG